MRRVVALVLLLTGCHGSTVSEAPSDSSVDGDAASAETSGDVADVSDSAPKVAGKPCVEDKDCDPDGSTGAFCAIRAPTPMCYGGRCSPPSIDPFVHYCGTDGVCLDDGSGKTGICAPMCLFDGKSDTLAISCLGKNACAYYGVVVRDGFGWGFGRCEASCGADSDCPSGFACQRETGGCFVGTKAYPGKLGDPCTDADKDKCFCLYGGPTKAGYCSLYCRPEATSACPAGYTCDPFVTKTLAVVPSKGMAGNCVKNCTTDAECAAFNAFCDLHAGTGGQKTCIPGVRP